MSVAEFGREMSFAWTKFTGVWLLITVGLIIGFVLLGFGNKFHNLALKIIGGGFLFLSTIGLIGIASYFI